MRSVWLRARGTSKLRLIAWLSLCGCLISGICVVNSSVAADSNSFIIEMDGEPKTIGDIKPTFIVYKDQALPKVSMEYVAKRYIKLFETAKSPDVKIDALNRINNINAKYGLTNEKLTIDKVTQSQAVLDSYNKIVDSGVFYQRMDELLYQTAKAMQFIGNHEESVKRLKMLVGLYPKSELYDESMFRMAEAYFDLGDYPKAEAQYKQVLAFSRADKFHRQTKFKLGWTAFRLNHFDEATKIAIETLDYYPSLRDAVDLGGVAEDQVAIAADTLRMLAIVFSKDGGAESIEKLQKTIGHQAYAYLLYDALFRFYLKLDRFEESALVANAFSKGYPDHYYAFAMAVNTIKSYNRGGFDIQEWQAKEQLVANFGINSHYWSQLNAEQKAYVTPIVADYLSELAHLYYVRMQKAFTAKDPTYQANGRQAAAYYLDLVATRPAYMDNGQYLYLAGEALDVVADYPAAIEVYQRAAYKQSAHADSERAGYAGILLFDKIKQVTGGLTDEQVLMRRASIEKYAEFFANDTHTPALLNDLANELMLAQQYQDAAKASGRVVEYTSAGADILYSSWLVNAHSNFELQHYVKAEQSYQKALGFGRTSGQAALRERLAASIYKQAELEPDHARSAELFLRVVDTVPEASIAPQALYDASSQLLAGENWTAAIAALNHFQSSFPNHQLYDDASEKLIFAYSRNGEPVSAAQKLVQVSSTAKDPAHASDALYRAAELYQQNGFAYESSQLFEKFAQTYQDAFDLNVEAHNHVVAYYVKENNSAETLKWRQRLVDYEAKYASKRTDRSAFLAAHASFELAQHDLVEFRQAKLTLPLKASLAHKKALLTKVVEKFEGVARYEVAELVSASTYQIGEIYRTLAKDLMASERPLSLSELELEQYNILLEEQAYPFEEQAMEIFRINLAKVPTGQFDEWINKTYQTLALMNPTEYQRELKTIPYATSIF